MRLAVVNLTGGGLSGGYRKYLQKMILPLSVDPKIDRLSVYLPREAHCPDLNFEIHSWTKSDARFGFRKLCVNLEDMAPDVVFVPTARWLNYRMAPLVVMVRNMEPLLVPFEGNTISTKAKNAARATAAYLACRKATRIIAVSEYVRSFLNEIWKVPMKRIGVVTHGVDATISPDEAVRPRAIAEIGTTQFVFAAGSIRPARGLRDILVAAAQIKKLGLPHCFVIGGAPDPDSAVYASGMKKLAEELGVADRIIWTGHLSIVEMAWCFIHCKAFAMTSWAEACPNIVLEALSYGCLAVSTDQPPMPEFFGESAYYYRARDGHSLAARLVEALSVSGAEQEAKRESAIARASRFDWRKTCDRTVEQLEIAIREWKRK